MTSQAAQRTAWPSASLPRCATQHAGWQRSVMLAGDFSKSRMCCMTAYSPSWGLSRQGALFALAVAPRRNRHACQVHLGNQPSSTPSVHPWARPAQGHKIPQGWKSTHKFVGAFMRDLQRAEDTPPLALGSAKTVRDLKKRAENIVSKVRCRHFNCAAKSFSLDPRRLQDCALAVHSQYHT